MHLDEASDNDRRPVGARDSDELLQGLVEARMHGPERTATNGKVKAEMDVQDERELVFLRMRSASKASARNGLAGLLEVWPGRLQAQASS